MSAYFPSWPGVPSGFPSFTSYPPMYATTGNTFSPTYSPSFTSTPTYSPSFPSTLPSYYSTYPAPLSIETAPSLATFSSPPSFNFPYTTSAPFPLGIPGEQLPFPMYSGAPVAEQVNAAPEPSFAPSVPQPLYPPAPPQVVRPANWLKTTYDTFPPKKAAAAPVVAAKVPEPKAVNHQKGPVKIIYFDLKGRGFFPMLVAEVGGVPYEWKKVAMEDWPSMKPLTPFGQLPVLEHGDITISQGSAIAAYIGRLAGLLGKEDVDFATSQMLVQQYEDMLAAMAKNYYSADKAQDMDKYFEEKLPADLAKVEKLVSGGFTNERTIGELAIFAFLNIILDMAPNALAPFPALTAFYGHLASHPKVAALLAGKAGMLWYKKDW